MQRNWIGRSEGAYVDFLVAGEGPAAGQIIRVFTTRPDTLFGATYMVLAPEHRLVQIITTPDRREEVDAYVNQAKQKSELDRTAETKLKTGVFTGAYAINPVNRQRVPIWVADYVLISYGTGSIMAVPAHDTRDLEFAEKFGLNVIQVVQPPAGADWRGFIDDGTSINSPAAGEPGFEGQCILNGLPTPEAKRKITAWLEEQGLGEGTVQYKLRDWLFSRQRYWGEPFPILYTADGRIVAVDESELPVTLPEVEDFKPHASDDPNAEPQVPLSRARTWITVQRNGRTLHRETNTMPQWAGSCWYYLRFCDPHNDRALIAPEVERYWLGGRRPDGTLKPGGIDLYLGGAEHAVLHLLYARFWHKVLYDLSYVSTPEPFDRLFNQGMIQSYAFEREDGIILGRDRVLKLKGREAATAEVVPLGDDEPVSERARVLWESRKRVITRTAAAALAEKGEVLLDAELGQAVREIIAKMSKALKNVINPDAIIREYGADTLRLYEMYMGPLEKGKPWNTRDIIGVHRFLHRVWRLVVPQPQEGTGREGSGRASAGVQTGGGAADALPVLNPAIGDQRDAGVERLLHKTIQKVTDDIQRFAFNTAIAQMIVWVNEAAKPGDGGKSKPLHRDQMERFLLLLAPFAPHLAEELWQRLGHTESIARATWPAFDPALARDDEVEIAVQVRGKIRGRMLVAVDATEAQLVQKALELEAVAREVGGKPVRRVIVAKGRLVNLIP